MSHISYSERYEQHGRVHRRQQEVNAEEQSINTSIVSQVSLLALRGGGDDAPCPSEPEPLHQNNMMPDQQRQLYYEAAMAAEPDPSAGYDINMNTQQQVAGRGGIGDPQQGGRELRPNQNHYNPSSHQSHEVAMQQQQSLQFQQHQQQQQFHSQQQLFLQQQSMQTQQAQSAHQQYYPKDMYPRLMNGGNPGLVNGGDGSSQLGSLNDYAVAMRHQQEVAMRHQQEVAMRHQQEVAMRHPQEVAMRHQQEVAMRQQQEVAMRQQQSLKHSSPNSLQFQASQGQADSLQSQVIPGQTKNPSYLPNAPFQRKDTLASLSNNLVNNLSVEDDLSNQQRLLGVYGVATAAHNSSPFELQISNHDNQMDMKRPSIRDPTQVDMKKKIEERELPEDVVEFLTASLNRLPSKVLSALCTLSCFGSSSDRSLVQLENELELNLSEALDHAVKEGLINKKNENYYFVDDRVQEATYSLMKPDERCKSWRLLVTHGHLCGAAYMACLIILFLLRSSSFQLWFGALPCCREEQ